MAVLTAKRQMFIKEYLVDLNATQAAIRAGYSVKTADVQGHQLLREPLVSAAIQEAMADRSKKLGKTAHDVAEELSNMGFSNIQDLYDANGNLLEINQLPRHVAAAIQSVKINLTEACAIQEIKLWDKKGSLELLGKHLGMFTDKGKDDENTVPPPTKVEIVVKDARKG